MQRTSVEHWANYLWKNTDFSINALCVYTIYRIQISHAYYKISSNHAVGLSSAQYLRICRACGRLQVHVSQKTWMPGGILSGLTHTRGDMYPPPSPLELENLSISYKDMFNGNPHVAPWTRWAWFSTGRGDLKYRPHIEPITGGPYQNT